MKEGIMNGEIEKQSERKERKNREKEIMIGIKIDRYVDRSIDK